MTRARKGVSEVQRTHFLSRRSRWHHQLGVEEFYIHVFCSSLSFFGVHTRYFELERAFGYELDGIE